jgi:Holliday junction DNA helicase RuvB
MANRPITLEDYIGQERMKQQLNVTMGACKRANRPLPHQLFSGPPGLGKTTIAQVVANEMGAGFHEIMASSLNSAEDLEQLLSQLSTDSKDIVFIDEIHRLNPKVEELLYPVMEDFVFEMEWRENGRKMTERFWVPEFTLIGATTLAGDLSRPLRDRFGIHFNMQNYTTEETAQILYGLADREEVKITAKALMDIAKRSRGVARIAINFFNRCREYAEFMSDGEINQSVTEEQFGILEIDELGLDEKDYLVLEYLSNQSTPTGVDTLVAGTNIDKSTILNVVEPYLIQQQLINRTPRGRLITDKGLNWLYRDMIIEDTQQEESRVTREGERLNLVGRRR